MEPKRPTRWEIFLIVLMILCVAGYMATFVGMIIRDFQAAFGS